MALPTFQAAGKQIPVVQAIGHIVVDAKYCCECRTCELACSLSHGGTVNPRLSGIRINAKSWRLYWQTR